MECLDEDFNFIHYMERMRLSKWETEQWEYTNKLNYNEYTEFPNMLVHSAGEEEFARQLEESKKEIQIKIGIKFSAMMKDEAAGDLKMDK